MGLGFIKGTHYLELPQMHLASYFQQLLFKKSIKGRQK
jgi:hypothetical protein